MQIKVQYIEWDGASNNLIEDINKFHYLYLIEQPSREQISTMDLDFFDKVIQAKDIWNKNRSDELNCFKIKPSSKSNFIA